MTDTDLPLSLRRTRRSSARLAAQYAAAQEPAVVVPAAVPAPAAPATPVRRRPPKSVRFSDVGVASTGLTPMIRRTALGTPHAARRRHSAPVFDLDAPAHPFSGEVTFLPLRQVLDGRVKRRLRRNGLSEEMNTIQAEKRQRAAAAQAELARLRADVASKDAALARLQAAATPSADEDVAALVQEVASLRRALAAQAETAALPSPAPATPRGRSYDWTMAARDPFGSPMDDDDDDGDGVSTIPDDTFGDAVPIPDDDDDDAFGDTTLADLQCSTPRRVRGADSFPTPPPTSPPWAAASSPPPAALPVVVVPRPHCVDAGVQAALPDAETVRLYDELGSLRGETARLAAALSAHEGLLQRIQTRVAAAVGAHEAHGDEAHENDALEEHVATLLWHLSDKTAALAVLSSELCALGFGTDASAVVATLAGALRAARLELEYVTPGEVALPLTGAGAAVLEAVLARLRALARQTRTADEQIDEYHALEQSLRQQLGSRVAAMDAMGRAAAAKDEELAALAATNADLEIGLDRLRGASASYARDLAELDALTVRLDAERAQAVDAAEALQRDNARLTARLDAGQERAKAAVATLQADLAGLAGRLGTALAEAEEEPSSADKSSAGNKRRYDSGVGLDE